MKFSITSVVDNKNNKNNVDVQKILVRGKTLFVFLCLFFSFVTLLFCKK